MKTKNYGLFTFKTNNRELSAGHVERIKQSIISNGYVDSRPILVNSDFVIIDGQHRFMACKDLGIDIHYEIQDGNDNQLLLQLNQIQLIWRLQDYVHHHSVNGVPFYKKVEEFEKENNLGISNSIVICAGQHCKGDKIREGFDFKINKNINKVVELINEFKKTNSFWPSVKLIRAITHACNVMNDHQFKKLKASMSVITEQAQISYYFIQFEHIINKRSENKIKLSLKS